MIKLAEKMGFQREATYRKARIVAGKYYSGKTPMKTFRNRLHLAPKKEN
jgi:RimJ/RimL family protein N-acetyltransferase